MTDECSANCWRCSDMRHICCHLNWCSTGFGYCSPFVVADSAAASCCNSSKCSLFHLSAVVGCSRKDCCSSMSVYYFARTYLYLCQRGWCHWSFRLSALNVPHLRLALVAFWIFQKSIYWATDRQGQPLHQPWIIECCLRRESFDRILKIEYKRDVRIWATNKLQWNIVEVIIFIFRSKFTVTFWKQRKVYHS